MTERLHGGAHPCDVAVMIGAEKIDHAIGPRELDVLVIRDVDGEVCRLAVAAPQHAVLVVARVLAGRRPEPEGAVVLVREPAPGELLEYLLGEPATADVALLGRPHVEGD